MQVLRSDDHLRMPWKNGGGVTTQIAVFPPGASVDNFDWRISMATVSSDGPFSLFAGIDRTLSILEGDGIALSVNNAAPVTLTRQSAPFAFAADVPAASTLLGGPVLDLNVMTRRGRYGHDVRRLELSGIESAEQKRPLPNPPHKGEGLGRPHRRQSIEAFPHVFSPLVGEMAGRPEGVFNASDSEGFAPSPGLRLLICAEGKIGVGDAGTTPLSRFDAIILADGETLPELTASGHALAYLVTVRKT